MNTDIFTMGFQQSELILKYSTLSGTEEKERKGYIGPGWKKSCLKKLSLFNSLSLREFFSDLICQMDFCPLLGIFSSLHPFTPGFSK